MSPNPSANRHLPPGPRQAAARGLAIAANQLGLPVPELAELLRAGDTVAEVAQRNGVAVDEIVAAMFAPVDNRVAARDDQPGEGR